jgi:hypothetical protein
MITSIRCKSGLTVWYQDQLLIQKLLKAEARKFLPIARTLDSTEGQLWGADIGIVDEDHAGLDTASHSLGPFYILVYTDPPRPNGESLAIAMASSSSLAGETRATGPKNSCL